MRGAKLFGTPSKVGSILPSGEIPEIHEHFYRSVVALRLFGGEEALHLLPEYGLLARQPLEVFRSGARSGALSPGLLHRSLLARDALPLTGDLLGGAQKLGDGSPLRLQLACAPLSPALAPHTLSKLVRQPAAVASDQSREEIVLLGSAQLRDPRADFRRLWSSSPLKLPHE